MTPTKRQFLSSPVTCHQNLDGSQKVMTILWDISTCQCNCMQMAKKRFPLMEPEGWKVVGGAALIEGHTGMIYFFSSRIQMDTTRAYVSTL